MKKSHSSAARPKSRPAPIPPGFRSITPHLVCAGAARAIAFYRKAFGATELSRLAGADGRLLHATIRIGDSVVMLNDEFPPMGAVGPLALKGSPVTIHLYVTDADRAFRRAVKAGARVVLPMADMFWGDRYGIVDDPFGHHWSIATQVRLLTPPQVRKAMVDACG